MGTNISGVDGDRPTPVSGGRVNGGTQSSGGAAPAVSEPNSVHITETAGQLATLEQTLQQMPSADEARVNAVRTAIEQGTYTISPENVADHLMQLEQALESLGQGK